MYERNLIEYLPEFLRDVKEYQAILTMAEQPEMVELWKAEENALKDQFISDATENGIARWEKVLGIKPNKDDDLELRRFTIKTRINEKLPFTVTNLKDQLELLCGKDGYAVTLDAENYTLMVSVALTARSSLGDVNSFLKRVVPANMIVSVKIKYNYHELFESKTHESLSQYTHERLRNEVM